MRYGGILAMVSLTSVAVAAIVAVISPLIVRLLRLPVPALVLELLLGVAIGPQLRGLIRLDSALEVLSTKQWANRRGLVVWHLASPR